MLYTCPKIPSFRFGVTTVSRYITKKIVPLRKILCEPIPVR